MLTGIGLILIVGYIGGKLVSRLKLPPLIGMLLVGIVIGPYVLDLLESDLLMVSQDIRTFALIIILMRAGLGIKKDQIKQVGSIALRISSIPCILEGLTITGLAYYLLNFSFAEAGMLGFIIAAVSPAVVVPSMLDLKEKKYGEDKQIPTLLLAGTSIDDVFAITLFTFFLGLGTSGQYSSILFELAFIPFSIIAGVLGGAVIAIAAVYLFKRFDKKYVEKLLILIAVSILFVEWGEHVGIASLLGVMTLGFILFEKISKHTEQFTKSLAGLWIFLQILLFALVGAEVNIEVARDAGIMGLLIIALGLIGRSAGVWIATLNTELNTKERIFCMIAYTPKATVQAAMGGIPLAMGAEQGATILALAVLSIAVTAPLGAAAIYASAPKLLNQG